MKTYYKKVDRSMMDWGMTIPKDHINDFLCGKNLKLGTSREIYLVWDKKKYVGKICHVNRRTASPVYQIRWDTSRDFLYKLRKSFIQSYVILKSQKELFDNNNVEEKYFRTNLEGGQQEVIMFTPNSKGELEIGVFIKIENEWNALFERLVDENVFGWIFDKSDKEYLIQKSTSWIKVKDFSTHKNAVNVIYYLANTKKKLLYIGKADDLSKRVRPGRKHQEMQGDWDIFKYDVIRPEFANLLERIEDHTIRTVASVLRNSKGYSSLDITAYTIVNAKWKKL
jgi:hypothetical protein